MLAWSSVSCWKQCADKKLPGIWCQAPLCVSLLCPPCKSIRYPTSTSSSWLISLDNRIDLERGKWIVIAGWNTFSYHWKVILSRGVKVGSGRQGGWPIFTSASRRGRIRGGCRRWLGSGWKSRTCWDALHTSATWPHQLFRTPAVNAEID